MLPLMPLSFWFFFYLNMRFVMPITESLIKAASDYISSKDNSEDRTSAMCRFDSEIKQAAKGNLNYALRLVRKSFFSAVNQRT
jgi:hypothetical protein